MKKNDGLIHNATDTPPISIPRKKLICGLIVLIVSFFSPLLIPLVIQLNISVSLKAIISGFLVFGLPEIGMLLAVVILGKEGFVYLKSLLFSWFKQTLITTAVSRTRYRIGIILFSATFIVGFLLPYIDYFSSVPIQKYHYHLIFSLDLLFFISLFILGGNFWDKLKALFLYDMIATNPKATD